jgi:hypothetical protein
VSSSQESATARHLLRFRSLGLLRFWSLESPASSPAAAAPAHAALRLRQQPAQPLNQHNMLFCSRKLHLIQTWRGWLVSARRLLIPCRQASAIFPRWRTLARMGDERGGPLAGEAERGEDPRWRCPRLRETDSSVSSPALKDARRIRPPPPRARGQPQMRDFPDELRPDRTERRPGWRSTQRRQDAAQW